MAKPKLALIPATQGSKLYSVLPADGVGDFNFSRGSAATRINKEGLIETVASGVSRLNYPLIDGVVNGCPSHLLEPSRSNLVTYSEDFSNAYWSKSGSSVTSGFISPNGTANAFKLTKTGSGNSLVRLVSGLTNVLYTNSFYIKRVSGSGNVSLILPNGTGEVVDIDNEWKRYSVTSLPSGGTGAFTGLILSQTNDEVLIYGAQLEQGGYATSYIPTSGSSVTRVAETANGAGDASTFNDSEGVLMVEISALANDGRIALNNGTTSRNVRFVYNANANRIDGIVYNGANQFSSNYVLPTQGSFNKISLKYKPSDFALWVNGFKVGSLVGSGTTFTEGTLSELDFDAGSNGLIPFYGKTKQIQYFDSALNDSDLETLTSWVSFTDLANGQLYSII